MPRVLIISDLHYDLKVFHGIDESVAFDWLLVVVDYVKPDVLLSAGDWGYALTPEKLEELKARTRVLTIYGNHENIEVLTRGGVLMQPGRVYDLGGLRVAGISGIVAKRRKRGKDGVPRRTPEEIIEEARRIARKGPVDILLLHQPPSLPELFPKLNIDEGTDAALEAVKIVKPRVAIVGHMHMGYRRTRLGDTLVVHLDSSQEHREFIVVEDGVLRAYRDFQLIDEVPLTA